MLAKFSIGKQVNFCGFVGSHRKHVRRRCYDAVTSKFQLRAAAPILTGAGSASVTSVWFCEMYQ